MHDGIKIYYVEDGRDPGYYYRWIMKYDVESDPEGPYETLEEAIEELLDEVRNSSTA